MFLAEAERLEGRERVEVALAEAIESWEAFPPSVILHHGEACCRIAHAWLLAMDRSLSNGGDRLAGPRWIRARYEWGPTHWPIHWCEALSAKSLDCGALAALAQEAFIGRGATCYTAQLIQLYTTDDSRHWHGTWKRDEAMLHWLRGEIVYHEACAVLQSDDTIRIWDPTASWWVPPKQIDGYGAVLAVRILAPATAGRSLEWGKHTIVPNRWQQTELESGGLV
jgi:hypothetical protein